MGGFLGASPGISMEKYEWREIQGVEIKKERVSHTSKVGRRALASSALSRAHGRNHRSVFLVDAN